PRRPPRPNRRGGRRGDEGDPRQADGGVGVVPPVIPAAGRGGGRALSRFARGAARLYDGRLNRSLVSKLTLNGLIFGRMTFGVAAWLAPRSVGNAVGLDMSGNPQAVYLARILAVRDLVLACGALGTDGAVQRQW